MKPTLISCNRLTWTVTVTRYNACKPCIVIPFSHVPREKIKSMVAVPLLSKT